MHIPINPLLCSLNDGLMNVFFFRKEARIVVDGSDKSEVREPPGPVRALQLNSPFVLGASVDYRDGFVGCIRALLLNGRPQDLRGYAERGSDLNSYPVLSSYI